MRLDVLRSVPRGLISCCLGLALLGSSAVLQAEEQDEKEEGFIQLFDGKSLEGWHKNPEKIGHGTGGIWTVEDGSITGEQDPPGSGNGGILLTDKKFGDFELRLQLKPDWGICSGLFVRSNDQGQCIQMMVDYHDAGNVGHIYGEGTGGFSNRAYNINGIYNDQKELTGLKAEPSGFESQSESATPEQFVQAWKVGEWNDCTVRVQGNPPTITTWINGTKISHFDGNTFDHPQYDKVKVAEQLGPEGSIAVQVHGGNYAWPNGAKCRWRKIRVKPL